MAENEYRVRPVRRYIVTHFLAEDGERQSVSSSSYGEFDNLDQAEAVGRAMHAANPGSTFVTVADKREPTGVYYAYTREQNDRLIAAIHEDNN